MKKQSEIIESISNKLKEQNIELSKADLEKVIKAYNVSFKEDLIETGKTKLPEIGNLEIRYRAKREGRNPKTKETITIPESLTVGLKVSSVLKKEVNEKVDISLYRPNSDKED